MAAKPGRSARDRRRRTHGQNFLVDPAVVERLLARIDLRADELVVDVGAGTGALTIPLAHAGVAGRVQWEVARKRAASPPMTLRSATWAPWWQFELGEKVPRAAFRPVPATDSGWLHVTRRDPPILPEHLAAGFHEILRPHWADHHT